MAETVSSSLFITFEGIERCGKGTQVDLLDKYLKQKGQSVIVTREPGATSIGETIRRILLDTGSQGIDARCEALLFAAARAAHVTSIIRPALDEGKIVICDRYIDSSYAYQSFGRGLQLEEVSHISEWATEGLLPDLTLFLKIPVEVAFERLGDHNRDRIEQEDEGFHERVADGFDKLSEMYKARYRVVDGTLEKTEIHRKIVKIVEEFL